MLLVEYKIWGQGNLGIANKTNTHLLLLLGIKDTTQKYKQPMCKVIHHSVIFNNEGLEEAKYSLTGQPHSAVL